MTITEFEKKYKYMTADEIISHLEQIYKDDIEVKESIDMAKKDIEYIKSQKNYKGQTPQQYALGLADHILHWN